VPRLYGDPTFGSRPRSGLESKIIEVMPKMARRKLGSDADNPEEGELDPAVNDRRRCKKNSPV